MLYIWPYITFFSLPILYPFVLSVLPPLPLLQNFSWMLIYRPRRSTAALIVIMMIGIVHFNTVVHPFTLADNRHYVFYVFRLLLRQPIVKYLAVLAYYLCGWAALFALAYGLSEGDAMLAKQSDSKRFKSLEPDRLSLHNTKDRASWVLIWLITTTLSLCTAPLVEPRYCILPWLFWRLALLPSNDALPRATGKKALGHWAIEDYVDLNLALETLWFLIINAMTGHIFLYRGFEWKQEPGRVQRFMW